ncbi:MAG: TIGR03086 family metal-binding protein [Actinomycetes bacterium]
MSETTRAVGLVPEALQAFTERVHGVPDDAWARQTPCTDWTVRDLLNHVTSEHLWAADLLAGKSLQEVGDRYDGDVLGDDPVAAWDRASAGSLAAWRRATPDQTVELSRGETPASQYAEEMLVDLVVHGWDLARGAGLDERMPRDAVLRALAFARAHESELEGSGMFAEPVPTESDDPQDQLVALLGRRP